MNAVHSPEYRLGRAIVKVFEGIADPSIDATESRERLHEMTRALGAALPVVANDGRTNTDQTSIHDLSDELEIALRSAWKSVRIERRKRGQRPLTGEALT